MQSICHCMIYMNGYRDHLPVCISKVLSDGDLGNGITPAVTPGMANIGKLDPRYRRKMYDILSNFTFD